MNCVPTKRNSIAVSVVIIFKMCITLLETKTFNLSSLIDMQKFNLLDVSNIT